MNGFRLNPQNLIPEAVEITAASAHDLPQLVRISEYAFMEHSIKMSPYEPGGPSGFDSLPWHQKALSCGSLYKISIGAQLLGAIYYSEKKSGTGWINRVFIHPEAQNRGIGKRVFQIVEQQNPHIRIWGLDTPRWAVDNLHFYHSIAYRDKEVRYIPEEGFELVILEKRMEIANTMGSTEGQTKLSC